MAQPVNTAKKKERKNQIKLRGLRLKMQKLSCWSSVSDALMETTMEGGGGR